MKKIFALIFVSIFAFSCKDFSLQKIKKSVKSSVDSLLPAEEEVVPSEEFAQGSEDVPLLVGMEKISEDSLGFDSSAGSIVSSSYLHKLNPKYVRDFYLKTLPQMGWQIVKNLETKVVFKRDKENLEIEFLEEKDDRIVRFFISSTI